MSGVRDHLSIVRKVWTVPDGESAFQRAYRAEVDRAHDALRSELEVYYWGDEEPLWGITARFVRGWRATLWAWTLGKP